MRYTIEVYEPDSLETILWSANSDTPFMAIQRGDLVQIVNQNIYAHGDLQVTTLEHLLSETDGYLRHKLCVFTRLVGKTQNAVKEVVEEAKAKL